MLQFCEFDTEKKVIYYDRVEMNPHSSFFITRLKKKQTAYRISISPVYCKIKEDLPSPQRVAAGWQHDVTLRLCNVHRDASKKGCVTGHQCFFIFSIIDIRSNNRFDFGSI